MNTLLKLMLPLGMTLMMSSNAIGANAVDVTFTDPNFANFSGSFEATDANGDGVISFSEVTSFFVNGLGAASLVEFGDFSIAEDKWFPDDTVNHFYYGATAGLSTYYEGVQPQTTITSLTSAVPEPTDLPMVIVGSLALIGAIGSRGRRQPKVQDVAGR